MNNSRSLTFQRPSYEQWEAVRFLVSKLWCEEQKTLPTIILHLRDDHGLHVSPKTLKTKLQEWGLIKKMNPQDAEDLLAAQARLDGLGQSGFLLLRGRYESIQRIHHYKRRRERANVHRSTKPDTKMNSASFHVVALSWHPRLRPEPALTLLATFESLLREMQFLLHAGKEMSLCIPGRTTLDWKMSTTESENSEKSLQSSIWESTRAFEEGEFTWAGLCWQSALLTLEDLIWHPDLNIWICFIRCCVRLARFQAKEVAQCFLWKLRGLRDLLPFSAPHRALVYALSELTTSDLVDGCLFVLELNLRNVELLWPLKRDCHIEYQLHLEEERLYQGLGATIDTSQAANSRSLIERDSEQDTWLQRSQISACMLLSEYDKAETIARSNISHLETQNQGIFDKQQGNVLSTLLSKWYFILGNIQYYKFDNTQSRMSYLKCLQLHQETKGLQTEHNLQPMQVHRTLKLVDWLNTTLAFSGEETAFNLGVYKQMLETEFDIHVQDGVKAPFLRRLDQTAKFSTKPDTSRKNTSSKYSNLRSVPERSRVVQRPLFWSVDHDKAHDANLPSTVELGRHRRGGGGGKERSTTKPHNPFLRPTIPWS